jgi:DNA-binding transcriptional regulator GbsR (MarR family)
MTVTVPDAIADLPPTSKLLYVLIAAADEPLTTNDMVDRSGMPRSTVHTALDRLRDTPVLVRHNSVRTPKGYEYTAAGDDAHTSTERAVEGDSRT